MRTRRAASSLLAGALLAAPLRASAARAPAPSAAAEAPAPSANVVALEVRVLRGACEALERSIVAHLTGERLLDFDKLRAELETVRKAVLGARKIPAGEREALTRRLLRDEWMLTRGAALARGRSRLEPRLEKILRAAASVRPQEKTASVDAVVGQLLSVATARDPASADRIFDNLRARLRASSGAAADLEAVKISFAKKSPIVYTSPRDPLYRLTNAAKLSRKADVPTAEPAASARGKDRFGDAVRAGLLDAVREQFATPAGFVSNVLLPIMIGLVLAAATGGVGLILKILLALGMAAGTIFGLCPALWKEWRAYQRSKEGSAERYGALRRLSALVGGVVIMLLLAGAGGVAGKFGGRIGTALPASWTARLSLMSAKISAIVPSGIAARFSQVASWGKASLASPKLQGAAHVREIPSAAPASAIHSVDKGYVLVVEESRSGANAGEVGRLARQTVADHMERALRPGQSVDPGRARRILAAALEKANRAVSDHVAKHPEDAAARVDLSAAIVAKDFRGGSVLISAKVGEAGVFLRRGGELMTQRPPASPFKRLAAAVKKTPAAEPAPGEAMGAAGYKAPKIQTVALKPKDVVFAASRKVVDGAERAVAELRIPAEEPGFLSRLSRMLSGREVNSLTAMSASRLFGLIPHGISAAPAGKPKGAGAAAARPIADDGNPGAVGKAETDEKGNKGGGEIDNDGDGGVDGGGQGDGKTRAASSAGGVAASGGFGGGSDGGSGGEGGGSGKHPKAPKPGGFGDVGGGGGGGGGSGGSGGGGAGGDAPAPQGGVARRPAAAEIAAAAPGGAQSAPFFPPSVSGRAARPPDGGGLDGGHFLSPSLASRFDGSREQPRSAGTAAADSMRGLGAGDGGGMPRLTSREATPPSASGRTDSAPREKSAASSASPGAGAAAPAVAARSEDADYSYTYLPPASQKYELPTELPRKARDWRSWAELGLEGSAGLAAAYLFFFNSGLGYLLTRRGKKPDARS